MRRLFFRLALSACVLLAACADGGSDADDDSATDDDNDDDSDNVTDDDIIDDDTIPGPPDDDDTTTDDDDAPPEVWWVPCDDFFTANQMSFVPESARCGLIPAPLDYLHPDDGRTMWIRFATTPAKQSPSHGTLAIELGGPASNLLNLLFLTTTPLGILAIEFQNNFDLLFVEARGTDTSSTPLVCPEALTGTPYANQDEFRALVKQCLADLATTANPAYMSTVDSIHDLDLVRRALEVDKLRLFGNSYGTRYMLEYIRHYEQHVKSYLFDSTLPPQTTAQQDFDRELKTLSLDCAGDPNCPLNGTQIIPLTETLLDQLDVSPLPGDIDGYTITDDLFHLGDLPQYLEQWPTVLAAASGGNPNALINWHNTVYPELPERKDLPTNGSTFVFDPYAKNVMCIDFPTWSDVTGREFVLWRLHPPYIALTQIEWMAHVSCEELELIWERTPSVDRSPVETDLPGLLIAPRLDESAPISYSYEAIEDGLSGAWLVPLNNDHAVLIDLASPRLEMDPDKEECLRMLAVDWLIDPFDPYIRPCVDDLAAPLQL